MIWFYSFLPFIVIALAAIVLFFIVGMGVFHHTVRRHKQDEKFTLEEYYDSEPEIVREFQAFHPVNLRLKSKLGNKLFCTLICSKLKNDKIMVLVHGIYHNRYVLAPYANEYLKRGYDVFIYNQRGTLGSGGHSNTYGYYERRDLDSCVEYLSEKYGYREIGVHGFSMGAATAAMHSALNEEKKLVNYYILDSPFSSMYDELLFVAERGTLKNPKKRKLPFRFLLWIGNLFNEALLRFGYRDVDQREAVAQCTVPMFIIHGQKDPTCPVEMGEELYDCKVQGIRKIWSPSDSVHINSYFDHRQEYFERVTEFIGECRDAEK